MAEWDVQGSRPLPVLRGIGLMDCGISRTSRGEEEGGGRGEDEEENRKAKGSGKGKGRGNRKGNGKV